MKGVLILAKLCFSENLTPIETKAECEVLLSENHICEDGYVLLEANVRDGQVWADIEWLDGNLTLECRGPAVCNKISEKSRFAVTSSTLYRLYSSDITNGEMVGLKHYVKLRSGVA